MSQDWRDPIHPGEILTEEMVEIGINASQLAQQLGVPKNRIYQIVEGKRSITADTALRLGKYFGTGPELWLNLQAAYELDIARVAAADSLDHIEPYHPVDAGAAQIAPA